MYLRESQAGDSLRLAGPIKPTCGVCLLTLQLNCHAISRHVHIGMRDWIWRRVRQLLELKRQATLQLVISMQTQEITIRVDPEAACAYLAASEDDRRKLDLLLSLRLQDVTQPGESLEDVMREIGRRAQERGLTPDILESILRDQ